MYRLLVTDARVIIGEYNAVLLRVLSGVLL